MRFPGEDQGNRLIRSGQYRDVLKYLKYCYGIDF